MAQPGFFNQNENRAYPFVLDTVNRPDNGPMTLLNLPNDIVVDCGFIMGAQSGFSTDLNSVHLRIIRRLGDRFYFHFESDAAELYQVPLIFTRHIDDEDYLTEHTDSTSSGDLDYPLTVSDSDSDSRAPGLDTCGEPLWSGFLVTGSIQSLIRLLPVDGSIGTRDSGVAVVEPALIQNLSNSFPTSFNVANDDRTRATAPLDCDDIEWPYEIGVIHIYESCLKGELWLKAGYNAIVQQNNTDNSITLGAGVGFGAGQPCNELQLFAGEVPPNGSNLLSGGPQCNEVLRSINGLSDRLFSLLASQGVTITSYPAENRIVVNADMSGLVLCFNQISQVSESV